MSKVWLQDSFLLYLRCNRARESGRFYRSIWMGSFLCTCSTSKQSPPPEGHVPVLSPVTFLKTHFYWWGGHILEQRLSFMKSKLRVLLRHTKDFLHENFGWCFVWQSDRNIHFKDFSRNPSYEQQTIKGEKCLSVSLMNNLEYFAVRT